MVSQTGKRKRLDEMETGLPAAPAQERLLPDTSLEELVITPEDFEGEVLPWLTGLPVDG